MKILLSLIILSLFVSCGEHVAKEANASKKLVKIPTRSTESLNAENHQESPDTFTFFFFPKLGTINWESKLFYSIDDQETKLSKIIAEVLRSSYEIDSADKKTYALMVKNEQIQIKIDDNKCDESQEVICQELVTEFDQNNEQATYLSSIYKSDQLAMLQMAIDDIKLAKTDSTGKKEPSNVVNWQEYGTAEDYKVKLNQSPIYLEFPTLGSNQNNYNTIDGSIYDVKLGHSQYDRKVEMLYFKMKEKGNSGEYTGNILAVGLEKSNFVGKIRFSGEVVKLNSRGTKIQEGVMKFELPFIEETPDDGDFDW